MQSSDIGDAAYDSLWYEHGIDSQKMMLYILLRCQRPIIITVPGLLAALTFQHYTSVRENISVLQQLSFSLV